MLSMKGRMTSGEKGVNFIFREERLRFAICQFSKKQVLVSSETAETAGGGEAIGAGCALGKNRRRRGKEVRPPGSSLS